MINREEHMELLEILKDAFAKIDERFDRIEQRLDYHETWLKRIDTKLADTVSKKDFGFLIKILEKKEIISAPEATHLRYVEIAG